MPGAKSPKTSGNSASISRSIDILVENLAPIDFGVDGDDFILYELNRLIEEERVSFEDEEFRILIDEGIRGHVEENLAVRSQMAASLRDFLQRHRDESDSVTGTVALRIVHALENTDSDLRNVAFVVRKYTTYLFEKLQSAGNALPGETESREVIESWKAGGVSREKLIADLQQTGRAALGPTAELLLDSPENRDAAETSLAVLSHVRSSVSARVLAYAVSEPMLDEDLEARAYAALRDVWPLARPYILHGLHSHAHEDLPFRWFQLLLDVDEVTSSEMMYEELRAHGSQSDYQEDLWALVSLLLHSRDPEIEDKVLGWINSPQTPQPVIPMLQEFLKEYRPPVPAAAQDPWTGRTHMLRLNEKYVEASRLFENGKVQETEAALEAILKDDPEYPFALALKSRLKTDR